MRSIAVQPINIIIDRLQHKITSEVENRSQSDDLSALVSVQALQDIGLRLNKIRQILNIQRYNLVFIGQVGAGKTTAICHLFNLVQEVETTRILNGKHVTIKKVKELLSTGAGKSTICEVVIRPAERTYVEIDPYDAKELQQLIEDFGLWIWQKAHPTTIKERVEIPPDELLRAIRNIVELPETTVNGVLHDRALEFATSFEIDLYDEFRQELIQRGKLLDRTKTETYPKAKDLDEKLWLSQVFQSLNVAKLPNFSIPKRIYLNLSDNILDFNHPRLGSVVDTRGLDLATKDRRDLAYYIRETDSSICIFTERFTSAPANVIQIIGKYLTPTAKDIDTKFGLLVMPRKGEPEQVIGADGQGVDDLELGIALRKANIDNVFGSENINFPFDNILFYDALEDYLSDGTKNIANIKRERKRVFAEIDRIIARREQRLETEIQTLAEQVEQIRAGKKLTNIEDAIVTVAKQKIREFGTLDLDKYHKFSTDYIAMLPAHHCVLRATNNRYGQYQLRDIDIYFNGRYLAESLIRQITQTSKVDIFKVVNFIETEISHGSTLSPLIQRLRDRIDQNYEALAIDLAVEIETILSDRLLAPQDYHDSIFWQQAIDFPKGRLCQRWGQGSGYKVDVLSLYDRQVATIDTIFVDLIESAWCERIIQPILTFLGD
jgi:DNA-binding transcriptional MerR regulator